MKREYSPTEAAQLAYKLTDAQYEALMAAPPTRLFRTMDSYPRQTLNALERRGLLARKSHMTTHKHKTRSTWCVTKEGAWPGQGNGCVLFQDRVAVIGSITLNEGVEL